MTARGVLDGLGTLERVTLEAAKSMSRELAALTELTASVSEVQLRERIFSLARHSLGERQSEVFDGLMLALVDAYPEGRTDDASVLMNSATPDVVRYLVESARRYVDDASQPGPDEVSPSTLRKKRDAALAKAFLAKNPQRPPGKLQERGAEVVAAADAARARARRAGRREAEAESLAEEAALLVFRDGSDPFEQGDRLEQLDKVRGLIAKERQLNQPE